MLDEVSINQEMNELLKVRGFTQMIKLAEQLIRKYPNSYLGMWWKAYTLTMLDDTETALSWFIEAIKKANNEKEESEISNSIASMYNIKRDWKQALNYAEISLELNPENVNATIEKSISLLATGKKSEAYNLLEDNKNLYKDYFQKARVSAIKKNKKKMLNYLHQAIVNNPHYRVIVQFDPAFFLYRRDPELQELIKN
jgi:tetratricopeptide (TPR) repeat protein